MGKWIGVDLDGTLAEYSADDSIGRPIAPMVKRIRDWRSEGIEVRIFTARAGVPGQIHIIAEWLGDIGLSGLKITDRKDRDILELWDDRAVRVQRNTGKVCPSCDRMRSGNHHSFALTDC